MTLGLSLTKDALTQAALRLRKLGTTQQVIFFAPVEVHQAISEVSPKIPGHPFDSSDVIRWILQTSAANLEAIFPLFWSNGKSFVHRAQAAIDNPGLLHDLVQKKMFLKVIRNREKLKLLDMYGQKEQSRSDTDLDKNVTETNLKSVYKDLKSLRKLFRDSGSALNASILTVSLNHRIS